MMKQHYMRLHTYKQPIRDKIVIGFIITLVFFRPRWRSLWASPSHVRSLEARGRSWRSGPGSHCIHQEGCG